MKMKKADMWSFGDTLSFLVKHGQSITRAGLLFIGIKRKIAIKLAGRWFFIPKKVKQYLRDVNRKPKKEWASMDEVYKLAGCSIFYAYQLVKRKKVKSWKCGREQKIYVDKKEFTDYVSKKRKEGDYEFGKTGRKKKKANKI